MSKKRSKKRKYKIKVPQNNNINYQKNKDFLNFDELILTIGKSTHTSKKDAIIGIAALFDMMDGNYRLEMSNICDDNFSKLELENAREKYLPMLGKFLQTIYLCIYKLNIWNRKFIVTLAHYSQKFSPFSNLFSGLFSILASKEIGESQFAISLFLFKNHILQQIKKTNIENVDDKSLVEVCKHFKPIFSEFEAPNTPINVDGTSRIREFKSILSKGVSDNESSKTLFDSYINSKEVLTIQWNHNDYIDKLSDDDKKKLVGNQNLLNELKGKVPKKEYKFIEQAYDILNIDINDIYERISSGQDNPVIFKEIIVKHYIPLINAFKTKDGLNNYSHFSFKTMTLLSEIFYQHNFPLEIFDDINKSILHYSLKEFGFESIHDKMNEYTLKFYNLAISWAMNILSFNNKETIEYCSKNKPKSLFLHPDGTVENHWFVKLLLMYI